jgi:hypothetical protein
MRSSRYSAVIAIPNATYRRRAPGDVNRAREQSGNGQEKTGKREVAPRLPVCPTTCPLEEEPSPPVPNRGSTTFERKLMKALVRRPSETLDEGRLLVRRGEMVRSGHWGWGGLQYSIRTRAGADYSPPATRTCITRCGLVRRSWSNSSIRRKIMSANARNRCVLIGLRSRTSTRMQARFFTKLSFAA